MIEIKSLRTQSEAHYDNGDGTRTVSIAANGAALHYFNALGKGDGEQRWRKCDQTIAVKPGIRAEHVDYEDDGWQVEFMPYTAHVPQRADGVATYIDQFSDGVKSKNRTIRLWSDCGAVQGAIDNTSFGAPAIVYTDAFGKGSDLIYIFLRSGLGKWVRVRAGETAQPAYNFQLDLPQGATVKRLGEGGYELAKDRAKVLDKPRMTEITDGAEGATYFLPVRAWWGRGSCALPIEIENVGNDVWRVTKSVPAEWDGTTDLFMDLTTTGTVITSNHYSDYVTVSDPSPPAEANWDSCHDAANSAGFDAYGTSLIYVAAMWVDTASDYWVCTRGRIAFTIALPPGSVINSGSLDVNLATLSSTGFNQNLLFVESTQADANALVAADFNNYNTTKLTAPVTITNGVTGTGVKNFPLTASGIAFLPINGTAKFAFMSDYDILDQYLNVDLVSGTPTVTWTSPNGGTIPVLNLDYTAPATGSPSNLFMMGVG